MNFNKIWRFLPEHRSSGRCRREGGVQNAGGFLFLLVQNGYQAQVDQIDLNVARSEEKLPFPGEMTLYEGVFVKRSSG